MTAIPMSHALLWWRLNPPETAFRCAYPQPAFRHYALTLAGWRELRCALDRTGGTLLLDQWFGLRVPRARMASGIAANCSAEGVQTRHCESGSVPK